MDVARTTSGGCSRSSGAKLVVLGGSGVATPELARALAQEPGRTVPLEVVLVGRDRAKLELVAAVSRLLAGEGSRLTISLETDPARALEGADYVLNQVRVGGLEARAFDETYPRAFGLPGEETVGPGGFADASRTIPVVLEYARLIERVAPQAQFVTFANPCSLVQYAVTRYTRVQTIGLCDAPVTMAETIARALGVEPGDLLLDYLGMHHFGFVTGIWRQGVDLLPAALEKAGKIVKDVEPEIVQAMGVIPGPYLRYVVHGDRMLAAQAGKPARAEELLRLQDEILADYERALAEGKPPQALARRDARWYKAIIAPVLVALVEGRAGRGEPARFVVNVVNGQAIPWLPTDAVVEVPALVEGGRVRPLATGAVGPDVVALLQANCAYEMLAVEAIVGRDRAKALRALLLNPIIHTYDQAAATLECAWAEGRTSLSHGGRG